MRTWKWPTVIGLVTAVGLAAGLLSDGGFGDALAWAGLTVPVVTALAYAFRRA